MEVTLLDGSTLPLDLPKAATGRQHISVFILLLVLLNFRSNLKVRV